MTLLTQSTTLESTLTTALIQVQKLGTIAIEKGSIVRFELGISLKFKFQPIPVRLKIKMSYYDFNL